jgi:hypothetical protein
MSDFIVKLLDESTWPDFARLVEKNNNRLHNKGISK